MFVMRGCLYKVLLGEGEARGRVGRLVEGRGGWPVLSKKNHLLKRPVMTNIDLFVK